MLPHGLTGRFPHLIDAPSRDRFEIPDDGTGFPPIEIGVCQPESRLKADFNWQDANSFVAN